MVIFLFAESISDVFLINLTNQCWFLVACFNEISISQTSVWWLFLLAWFVSNTNFINLIYQWYFLSTCRISGVLLLTWIDHDLRIYITLAVTEILCVTHYKTYIVSYITYLISQIERKIYLRIIRLK